MKAPELITTTAASRRKGCTRQAIVNALKRGDLNGRKVGPLWLVDDDATLGAYAVPETGARMHEAYKARHAE